MTHRRALGLAVREVTDCGRRRCRREVKMTQSADILSAWVLFLRNKLGDHLPDQNVARDRIGKEQLLDMLEELEAARGELAELRGTQRAAIDEALRQQAREWCRSVSDGEGPPLEQLLAIARHHRLDLIVTHDAAGSCEAGWWSDDAKRAVASAKATGLTAAIRAATRKLLGLDGPAEEPRQTCGSCEHWRRDDEPATKGGARPCGLDEEHNPTPRHPGSSCGWPGCYKALGTAKTDPAPESGSSYPSSDEALAAKIAEVRSAMTEGVPFPDVTRKYLDELLAEQRRRLNSPPLKGVSRPAANIIRSRGDG